MTETARKFREALHAEREYFEDRVGRDTETNRKGFVKLYPVDAQGRPLTNATVELRQKTSDFDFGCNIFMLDEYDTPDENEIYKQEFSKLFNLAVVPFYWEGTEPRQGYLRYEKGVEPCYRRPPADLVTEYCQKAGLRMKGHPLFWHEFVPHWLPTTTQELKRLLVKRFREISERYADVIGSFDVVNEPSRIFDCNQRKEDRFYHLALEEDYCKWIFDLANRYFPANRLFLNDTVGAAFFDYRGEYSAYYQHIKNLLNEGVRIDAIGMQCHLCPAAGFENVFNQKRLYHVLDTYGRLNRPIHISEISMASEWEGVEDQELQAELAESLYRVCFSHKSVQGIVWWNLPDNGILTTKHQDENLPTNGLLDGKYREKQAFKTLQRLINEEWRTNVTLESHARDYVTTRAFYGTYAVRVNGKPVEDIHIAEDGLDEMKLIVK